MLLLTYRCLHGMAPQYLTELITPYQPSRQLRSSDQSLLTIPTSRLKTYGDKSFSVAAPMAWNNLPFDLRSQTTLEHFKKNLKTHLFRSQKSGCLFVCHILYVISICPGLILQLLLSLYFNVCFYHVAPLNNSGIQARYKSYHYYYYQNML